jgi:HD superfamily phosphohydrolase
MPDPKHELENKIDEYVQENLPNNLRSWCERYKNKFKIIHDSLWGTFQLQPHEVAILDTPLVQRLRFIHQTGAVYYTYPSAHHTRFEHTLGVIYQTGRLCDALQGQHGLPDSRIDTSFRNDVRLAALLHDIGHGPFSHTSEQFFASLPQMADYKARNNVLSDSGAGEVLSYLVVRSEPFRSFVGQLNETHGLSLSCDRVAGIITGTLPDEQMYMSELIHGPFDADKLDYMPRDGMFSGLQMHVDIDRLYHSITIKTGESNGQRQTRIAGR